MAAIVFLRFSVFFLVLFRVLSAAAAAAAASSWTVKFLPGLAGPLPFVLETGYVGVGDSEEVQLFYYFVKSEGNPQKDPLLIWLTGGPCCSVLTALGFQIGPIGFKEERYNGSLPQLFLNPYSWTKKSSIIFVDLPASTGFSYGRTPRALKIGDSIQAHHCHQFLRKWLVDHPEFISNTFYVAGDSYSGLIVPVVTQKISEGNKHDLPFVNLQGYILGNPVTIRNSNQNFEIPYAHRMTLISDELFESLTTSCKGEYANIDPSNVECLKHYDTYKKFVSEIEKSHILLPKCPLRSPKQQDISGRRSLYYTSKVFLDPKPPLPSLGCPSYKYLLGEYWANNDQVRKALHIREGTIGEWKRCMKYGENYKFDIDSVVPYHVNLSSKSYRSLIYSGDHDMIVPHLDTQAWIRSLNYSITDDWRPWFIMDQVAGYTRTYANKMTFATIKGGGHTTEFTQKEGSTMFSRWITKEPL